MPDRVPLIAGNWKMHKTVEQTEAFLDDFLPAVEGAAAEVALCPPFTALAAAVARCARTPVRVVAQNMHEADHGAFTGEISASMLAELGVDAVILGHSERREHNCETDTALARKVPAALAAGLLPILCVGERENERDAGETEEVLRRQVEADLAQVESGRLSEVVIAYEPIWAIGTGRTATTGQAQEASALIRSLLASRDPEQAARARILYGGSVKPSNAGELIAQAADVDGALVGGASLEPADLAAIVAVAAP